VFGIIFSFLVLWILYLKYLKNGLTIKFNDSSDFKSKIVLILTLSFINILIVYIPLCMPPFRIQTKDIFLAISGWSMKLWSSSTFLSGRLLPARTVCFDFVQFRLWTRKSDQLRSVANSSLILLDHVCRQKIFTSYSYV